MNAQALYEHIVQHITPEAALLKLLESSIIQYEKLKMDKGEEVHPLLIISMAAMDLGWEMAIEKDQEEMRGIAVGTKEYIDNLYKKIPQ